MKPTRLRAWIRKYGDWGHLLAGLWLSAAYFRTNRRAKPVVGSVCATLAIVGIGLWRVLKPMQVVGPPLRISIDKRLSKRDIEATTVPSRKVPDASVRSCGILAYVRNGDIYVQPLPTGARCRLTRTGQCRRPRWSASGQWLAFAGDGHLWVMRRNGKQVKRLSDDWRYYTWSPVSDLLACYRQERLCLLKPAMWRQRVLLPAPPLDKEWGAKYTNEEIAWSPDGQWLTFVRHHAPTNADDTCSSLWRLRPDGSNIREIYKADGGDMVHPELLRWFPDGSRILFWTKVYHASSVNRGGAPLVSVARDGGETTPFISEKQLVSQWDDSNTVLLRNDFVAFSPDGSTLAVTQGGGRDIFENKHLFAIDVATGSMQQLTDSTEACSCPTWSPDGTQIAYIAVRENPNLSRRVCWRQLHLWRMDADGTHKHPLLQDPKYRDDSPHWLADGKHLLLTRYDSDENPSLWIVGSDGQEARKIANVGNGDWWEGTELNGDEDVALWTPIVP